MRDSGIAAQACLLIMFEQDRLPMFSQTTRCWVKQYLLRFHVNANFGLKGLCLLSLPVEAEMTGSDYKPQPPPPAPPAHGGLDKKSPQVDAGVAVGVQKKAGLRCK